MSLRVGHHLQLVFHIAQKEIGALERIEFVVGNECLIAKREECAQSVASEYSRKTRAMANLKRLNDEVRFRECLRRPT
jgi:hypothetical protein